MNLNMISLIEKRSSEIDNHDENQKKDVTEDPETFSCLLQPCPADSDPNYIGIRRLLLFRKAQSGVLRRKDWRCNGKGYVAYRSFINRPDNRLNSQIPSRTSTPGTSERWISSPSQLSLALEVESWAASRAMSDGYLLQVNCPLLLRWKAGLLAGQGHGYPVIAVAWNYGENLLASSGFGGTVIVWKREKTKQKR
ncbi:hypothetical protein R6Q57_008574 [Mikania cordata]